MTEERVPADEPESRMGEEHLPAEEPESPLPEPSPELPEPTPAPEAAPAAERGAVDENDKLMAAISYIVAVIVPIIILASESARVRPFQRYHAIQSLGLSVVSVVW
ncbi:MAG: hypothetical protein GX605_00295, partial [Chloroflexi bacterium]|nr:hypothetical protein [Chloroflexota bacterium]